MNRYNVLEYGVKADCEALQTAGIQHCLDLCREGGGTVVIPRGCFYVSSLRLWSDTTLYLERGARLIGSEDCEDYETYPIPEGMEMRSDMELITQYYADSKSRTYGERFWAHYRRAMLTAYGEKNIAIVGECDSVIDGRHCYDPEGEEGYRGPHIVFLSCCENVTLEGYTAQNAGNFLHEANNCRNLVMRHVTCLAGSDGIHLHCTENAVIEDCLFKTGDDCIAGINIQNMTVRRCVLNTSCNLFRMGGVGILVEDCYAYGPGYYPHRMTVVKGRGDELPRTQGRHTLLRVVDYFASTNYLYTPSDIHFRNCAFEGIRSVLKYNADVGPLQSGTHWGELTMDNVRLTDVRETSTPTAPAEEPFSIKLKNVTYSFAEGATDTELFTLPEGCNTTLSVE
ncbi:MAG: hypothetical protein IJW44_00460 [Clostridia bacterium]|nr:hypothetical protein [Clostridia bacterium]